MIRTRQKLALHPRGPYIRGPFKRDLLTVHSLFRSANRGHELQLNWQLDLQLPLVLAARSDAVPPGPRAPHQNPHRSPDCRTGRRPKDYVRLHNMITWLIHTKTFTILYSGTKKLMYVMPRFQSCIKCLQIEVAGRQLGDDRPVRRPRPSRLHRGVQARSGRRRQRPGCHRRSHHEGEARSHVRAIPDPCSKWFLKK